MTRGRFVVLEGGEGAGKSTQLACIREWLAARGREVVTTREPGGTEIAERIRALLLDSPDGSITPTAETLLVFAARSLHIDAVIAPTLAAGHDVVCDRFVDASFAYQGAGRGVDPTRIAALESWVCGSLRPDLVIVLDIDPAEGRARAAERSAPDRFEREAPAFAERVRQGYLARARAEPGRYAVVDAAAPPEQVSARIHRALGDHLTP